MLRAASLAVVLAAVAAPAAAAPCYVIYDRNDTVVYRDYDPPFDLSNPKAPERGMMRRQGRHLLIAEFENCNPVGYISATTGGSAASVDEIVMQLKPAIGSSVTGNTMALLQAQPGRPAYATKDGSPAVNPAAITVEMGNGGVTPR